MKSLPVCTKCPLHLTATNILVPGKGSDEPTIMFVGIAPGWQEDKNGECFIGKAGQKLKEMIDEAGIDYDTCRFTNLVRCIPWKDKNKRKVRDPTDDEIESCCNYLVKEIALYDPEIIVPLGKIPASFFLPHKAHNMKITKISGGIFNWVHPTTDKEYTIIPTLHPAAICRSNHWLPKVLDAFNTVKNIATGKSSADIFDDCDYEYLDTLDKVKDYVDRVIDNYDPDDWTKAISVDVETGFKAPLPENYTEETGIDGFAIALNPYNPYHIVVSVQLSHAPKKGALIPLWHMDSPFKDYYSIATIGSHLQRLVDNVPVIGQNFKFDWQVLYVCLGVEVKNFLYDSMLAHYLLYQKSRPMNLESMAGSYVDMPFFKQEMHKALDTLPEKIRHMGNVELDKLIRYGCGDCDAVYRLYIYWRPILEENGLWDVYVDILQQATISYSRIEVNGMLVAPDRLDKLKVDYVKELDALLKKIRTSEYVQVLEDMLLDKHYKKVEEGYAKENAKRKLEGRAPVKRKKWTPKQQEEREYKLRQKLRFKPSSPDQLRLLFYDENLMDFDPTGKGLTKTKNVSADKNARELILQDAHQELELVKEDDPDDVETIEAVEECIWVIEAINEWVGKNKLHSAYIKSAPALIHDKGDIERVWPIPLPEQVCAWCFHANFKIHGTDTGRLSCEHPNLQQVPFKSLIKWMFISRWADKGGVLLQGDYSQAELRVLAKLCDEKEMLGAFNRGEDIHMFVARLVFGALGVPPDKIDKAMRRIAKRASFGIVYGQGAKALAKGFGTSVAEAKEIIKTLYKVFPNLRGWMDDKKQEAIDEGLVTTPMGRIRWIVGADSRDEYVAAEAGRKAVNTPIQCLPGATRIFTSLGYRRIDSLVGQEFSVIVNGVEYACEGVQASGKKRLFKIHLSDGSVVESSGDHRWATFGYPKYVWVRAKDISQGARMLLSMECLNYGDNSLNVFTDTGKNRWGDNYGSGTIRSINLPPEMTENVAELIGKMVADGNYSRRGRMAIVEADRSAFDHYVDILSALGCNVRVDDSSKWSEKATKPLWRASFDSVQLWSYFKNSWGLKMISGAHNKVSPTAIFRATSSVRAAYLRGLFQGDGTMTPDGFPLFVSMSERLCLEIQELLKTLGIASSCSSYSGIWKVCIKKLSSRLFMDVVGFVAQKHQEALERLTSSSRDGQCLRLEPLHTIESRLHRLMAGSGSWYSIRSCAKEAEVCLPEWFECSLPVEVVSVEDTGIDVEMYDVVESKHPDHAFVAGALVCHNSAASDWTLCALNEIQRRFVDEGLKSLIVATIHDSIMVDVYPGELLKVMEIMHHEMVVRIPERFDWIKGVTPKTDFEFGVDWKAMTDIEVQPDLTYKLKGEFTDIKKNLMALSLCGNVEQLDAHIDKDSPEDSWALVDLIL